MWSHGLSANASEDSYYTYNSAGETNSVEYVSTGRYRVSFPGVYPSTGGNVQVTAYGTNSNRCKVGSWLQSGTGVSVEVRCHNAAGAAADSLFTASFLHRTGTSTTAPSAYVWYSGTAASTTYTHNSAGLANEVEKTGTGEYKVTLNGLGTASLPRLGHALVTAYGTDAKYCKVVSFVAGLEAEIVDVACFDSAGAAADSPFTVAFDTRFVPAAGDGGYVWANQAASASYTPSASYQYVEIGGAPSTDSITATRSSAGSYALTFPGLTSLDPSLALAVAYGSTSEHCKVQSWGLGIVAVRCYTAAGVAADSRFLLTHVMAP
jgi:hypothetical protein